MRAHVLVAGLLAAFTAACAERAVDDSEKMRQTMNATIEIPGSLKVEHEAIHSELVEATRAAGQVGVAARRLAEVLHPHFVREEEIALPPLGVLQPLADGAALDDATAEATLRMTDALRSELPRMLEEHVQIRAAVEQLRTAAAAEGSQRFEQLANDLALHARTEEEVLYPAAVLVGDLIRARSASGR